jgi:hypothetical protein
MSLSGSVASRLGSIYKIEHSSDCSGIGIYTWALWNFVTRALFLVLLMLTAPLSAFFVADELQENLETEPVASTSGRVATNPLGWEWVTKDYDAGYVWTREVEVDAYGNTYVSGIFRGGSLSLEYHHALNNGGLDVFVAKFSSLGDCVWLTTFGGTLDEHVEDMILDSSGDVYVVGSYDSPQFNASSSLLNNSGSRDGFVVSIARNSGAISWGSSVNGVGFDNITGVTLDSNGGLVYSGWTSSPQLTINGTTMNNSGDTDFFVLWGHTNGSWDQGRIYGGTGKEQAHDIAADGNGKVMVVAEFTTSSMTLDQTSISHGGGTGSDSLVMRVARSGVEWVRKPICSVNDRAWAVDVDSAGNVFVAGEIMANTSSGHQITWGSIQISRSSYHSVYIVKFSNVGAIGWALETYIHSSSWGYYARNPSLDIEGSHLLIGLNINYRFQFYSGSYQSNTIYPQYQSRYSPNSLVVELSNTGSMAGSNYMTSQYSSIDDVAWMDMTSGYDHVIAPINGMPGSAGSYHYRSDAPATTLQRYSWNSGPSSQQFYRLIGYTGAESIIDLEPLNATSNVLLGSSSQYGQNLRFGNAVIGGGVTTTSTEQSRLFLAVSDSNGTWTKLDQINMGGHLTGSTGITTTKDWAAMAVGSNGTVWVAFHWQNWLDIPGLTSRQSGSGFIVASWSVANGWMSADTIGFGTSHYVDVDIAVSNGDVWFSSACYGTTNMHGTSYSGSNYWNICIAKRDATNSWNNIYRSGNYYYNYVALEAMTDHPNGGVVFWAKSGNYNNPSGGSINVYSRGALIRLFSSNGTMWWMGEPTCGSSTSNSAYCSWVESLDVTSSGDVLVTGYFENSASFSNCCSVNSGGSYDGFLAKFNSSGQWDWSISLGGTSDDRIHDVRNIGNGSIAVVGQKYGVISVGLTTLSSAGTGFVAMAADQGTWEWAAQPTGNTVIQQVVSTGNGTIEVAGVLGYHNIARTFGLDSLNSSDGDDIFLSRMSADADADGITNNRDNCQQIYNPSQLNYDSDTLGDICDLDDDGEGIADTVDSCPQGFLMWTSNNTTDHDTDGCKDDVEDDDDDNDGRLDASDACAVGTLNWTSNGTTDYDTDGCKDSNEDIDDDDDTVNDTADACPKGSLGWLSTSLTDHDGDGCLDADEDGDDDDDGITDDLDACYRGELNWTSSNSTDNDGDGCLDVTEDINDDNDDFFDYDDSCPNGTVDWHSGSITDYDGDGCKDSDEDLDDDADGVPDVDDDCPRSPPGWRTNPTVDYDADGCHDWNEDDDDDNDDVGDLIDLCSRTTAGAAVNSDGCASGQIPDTSGGGGGSVNMTEENQYENNTYVNNTYVNNTYVNNTYDNETFDNQSFQNNTYGFNNETFLNQTYLNSSSLNQTFNEGDIVNDTAEDDTTTPILDADAAGGFTWEPLAAIVLLALIFIIQAVSLMSARKRGKDESTDSGSSIQPELAGIDQTVVVLEAERSEQQALIQDEKDVEHEPEQEDETDSAQEQDPVTEEPDKPDLGAVGRVGEDGLEWLEHPTETGRFWYRQQEGDDWQFWYG